MKLSLPEDGMPAEPGHSRNWFAPPPLPTAMP